MDDPSEFGSGRIVPSRYNQVGNYQSAGSNNKRSSSK